MYDNKFTSPATPYALVVEDDSAMEMILVCMLRRHGFTTRTCVRGSEALIVYQERRPDLIVLDWNLPDLNGLDICRHIRDADPSRGSYILMSTANNSTQHLREALDAGIDDYLAKPFTMELLDVRLRIAQQRMHDRKVRKQAESAMYRTQEMVAIGTLASGITHEFNNINAIVLGSLDLVMTDPTLTQETHGLLEAAQVACRKSTSLTRQLLRFVGDQRSGLQIANVNQILESMLSILQAEYEGSGITVTSHLGEVPFCALDSGPIGQVMLHMLMNARHALEGCEKRHIDITTGCEGDFCFFKIQDTGCGIAPEDQLKVFLPFFSRKGEHATGNTPQARLRGAGLGLSVSDTIVRNHGGRIELESTQGKGTTFTVHLPIRSLDGSIQENSPLTEKRILVVGSDAELVRWLSRACSEKNTNLYTASDYGMAIAWHHKTPFDLVVMPAPRSGFPIEQNFVDHILTQQATTLVQVYPETRREEALDPAQNASVLRLLQPLKPSDLNRVLRLLEEAAP